MVTDRLDGLPCSKLPSQSSDRLRRWRCRANCKMAGASTPVKCIHGLCLASRIKIRALTDGPALANTAAMRNVIVILICLSLSTLALGQSQETPRPEDKPIIESV